jgi:hypothetical protein
VKTATDTEKEENNNSWKGGRLEEVSDTRAQRKNV